MSSTPSIPEELSQLTSNLAIIRDWSDHEQFACQTGPVWANTLWSSPDRFKDVDQEQLKALKDTTAYRYRALRQSFYSTLHHNIRNVIHSSVVGKDGQTDHNEGTGTLIIELPLSLVEQLGNDKKSILEELGYEIGHQVTSSWIHWLAEGYVAPGVDLVFVYSAVCNFVETQMTQQGIDCDKAFEDWCRDHQGTNIELIEDQIRKMAPREYMLEPHSSPSDTSMGSHSNHHFHWPITASDIASIAKDCSEQPYVRREHWASVKLPDFMQREQPELGMSDHTASSQDEIIQLERLFGQLSSDPNTDLSTVNLYEILSPHVPEGYSVPGTDPTRLTIQIVDDPKADLTLASLMPEYANPTEVQEPSTVV